MPPSFRHFLAHSRSFISLQYMRKASDHAPSHVSRFTGVPYSIVQRATSDTVRYGSMVCESLPGDEEFETYIDDSEYEKYPEY